MQQSLVGKVRPMLVVLMAAVVLIVLVVSLNIGSLLLARASGRQQEMAVRAAMGASGGRDPADAHRIAVAGFHRRNRRAYDGGDYAESRLAICTGESSAASEVNIDWRVLGFALLISLATGLLFGLAPAIHSSKANSGHD